MKKIHIFTHRDLDGAGSYLVAKWFLSSPSVEITYTPISSPVKARSEITSWLVKHSFNDFSKVYFLDLDVYDNLDLIDHDNVTIIDHHLSHATNIKNNGGYTNAKSAVVEYTSCAKLLYKLFSKQYPDITLSPEQKLLVALCDDYDCYALRIKYSKPLNMVFYGYNDSFNTFVTRFVNGFDGFNSQEKSMIRIEYKSIEKAIEQLEVYTGTLGKFIVVAGFAEGCINDVHSYMLEEYPDTDISIVVIPKTGRVSFRKQQGCSAPLHIITEKLCDGGGHEYAAGGKITPTFESFTKLLTYDSRKHSNK